MKNVITLAVIFMSFGFLECQPYNHTNLDYATLFKSSVHYYNIGDLENAMYFAKLTGNLRPFPVTSHMRYYLRLAKECQDKKWLIDLSKQLVRGGATLRYVKNHLDEKTYNDIILISHELELEFSNNFRNDLRNLYSADSVFNSQYHAWINGDIEFTKEDLILGAERIYSGFMELKDRNGVPSESTLGYFVQNNKLTSYHTSLFIHIYQRGELVLYNELDSLYRAGMMDSKLVDNLKKIRGYGDSSGIRNEMNLRYEKFSK